MSKPVIQTKTFGFMQYFDERYWDWSDDEKDIHFKDTKTVMMRICARLYDGLLQAGEMGDDLKFEFAGINHDKDTDLLWDKRVQMEVIEPIAPHLHGVVTLSKKRVLTVIAKWIGLKPEFIERPRRGPYGKQNMLAYLIHAKSPDKYQYSPSEVETFGTFDYEDYWAKHKPDWDRQKATVQMKQNKISVHWLVKQVQQGRIDKKEIMMHDNYSGVYADNMGLINDAIQFYGEKKGYETLVALENGEFELSVAFITGAPNSGKTHYALKQINHLVERHGWRCYSASAKNPMDGYNGEEIVLIDDLRADSMSATDWLQMLDPRTTANISARYKNKQKAFRAIIITSYLEPQTFFNNVKSSGGSNEALEQFIRRIMLTIKVHRISRDGRIAEINAIGISPHPVIYDVEKNVYLIPDENAPFYDYDSPVLCDENNYSSVHFDMINYNDNLKLLNHVPFLIYRGDVDDAVCFVTNIIADKNDIEKDHSNTERPDLGNASSFLAVNLDAQKLLSDDFNL